MSFRNPVWSRRILRGIGIANILFAVFGGFLAARGVAQILPRLRDSPIEPYEREVYCIMTLVDLCCLLVLSVGGIYLSRLHRIGLKICNIVFAVEIAWFLAGAWIPLALGGRWAPLGDSIAAAGGIGAVGTGPQIITGYPVLALIFLNLARGGFPDNALHT